MSKKRQHQSKNIKHIEDSDSDESTESDGYAFGLSCDRVELEINSVTSRPKINVKINGYAMNILIDTGSSINVIDEDTYCQMKK